MTDIEWSTFPGSETSKAGLKRYVELRIKPGSFLCAMLQNDLTEAVGRADSFHRARLADIATWLYNNIPSDSWGSPESFAKWLNKG